MSPSSMDWSSANLIFSISGNDSERYPYTKKTFQICLKLDIMAVYSCKYNISGCKDNALPS